MSKSVARWHCQNDHPRSTAGRKASPVGFFTPPKLSMNKASYKGSLNLYKFGMFKIIINSHRYPFNLIEMLRYMQLAAKQGFGGSTRPVGVEKSSFCGNWPFLPGNVLQALIEAVAKAQYLKTRQQHMILKKLVAELWILTKHSQNDSTGKNSKFRACNLPFSDLQVFGFMFSTESNKNPGLTFLLCKFPNDQIQGLHCPVTMLWLKLLPKMRLSRLSGNWTWNVQNRPRMHAKTMDLGKKHFRLSSRLSRSNKSHFIKAPPKAGWSELQVSKLWGLLGCQKATRPMMDFVLCFQNHSDYLCNL